VTWTSLDDEATLISGLVATGRCEVSVLGTSADGIPLRLLRLGDPPPSLGQHIPLLIIAEQHGNEPAGREAALLFADYLTTTTDPAELAFLADRGVAIMPTTNPDGFEAGTRDNASGADVNRHHMSLSHAENRAIATALGQSRPLLAIDLHEAFPQSTRNITFAPGRLVAIDTQVRAISDAVVTAMKARATAESWTNGDYGDVDGEGNERIFGSNAGLRLASSVLVETSRNDDTPTGQTDRTDWQYAMCEEALAYTIANLASMSDVRAEVEVAHIAAGGIGAPIDIRSTVIDPAPVAYQLDADQVTAVALHLDLFNVAEVGGLVSMAQTSRLAAAFLLDARGLSNVAVGQPLFASQSSGGLAQVAHAVIRTRVTWLACDVVTGRKIAELPDISAMVERVLAAYTSTDVVVPLPLAGPGALPPALVDTATAPVTTMVVLVVNDVPSWAGWVRDRVGGTGADLHLPCVTLEGYLRARRVRDHAWVGQDLGSVIGAGLAGDAGDLPGVGAGIGLVVDAPPTGILRDRTYLASDRQTVYDALRELAGVGLEWTIDLDWADSRQQVVNKILRMRTRIGVAAVVPRAKFATESGAEVTYRLSEDNSDGRHANYVVAYAPGEGEDQPASTPAIDQDALDAGAPVVELHWQPSSSITEVGTLDAHAVRRLAEVRHGSRLWKLSARWDRYPRLNVDWAVGDDIGWDVVGHRHPAGVTGVGRAVGWVLDTATGLVSPRLLDPLSDPGVVS
jgi:hypothetical protein